MILYILQETSADYYVFQVIARATLYSTGFFNFLVFGMQDPHLRRSIQYIYYRLTMKSSNQNQNNTTVLISNEVIKSVMFDESKNTNTNNSANNTVASDGRRSSRRNSANKKNRSYKLRRLSETDKNNLYVDRPDLDLRESLIKPKRQQLTDENTLIAMINGQKVVINKNKINNLCQQSININPIIINQSEIDLLETNTLLQSNSNNCNKYNNNNASKAERNLVSIGDIESLSNSTYSHDDNTPESSQNLNLQYSMDSHACKHFIIFVCFPCIDFYVFTCFSLIASQLSDFIDHELDNDSYIDTENNPNDIEDDGSSSSDEEDEEDLELQNLLP